MSNDVLSYSWKWFEYHAAQRLIALRYFLILIGIAGVGITNAADDERTVVVFAISACASFLSLAFFFLELRNEELVDRGRDALRALENSPLFDAYPAATKVFHSDDAKKTNSYRHAAWLKAIYILSILGFGLIAILNW